MDMFHVDLHAELDGCKLKQADNPADFDYLLGIELQTTPTIKATEINLFFNGMKVLNYYSRQETHKKPAFISSMSVRLNGFEKMGTFQPKFGYKLH